MLHAGEGMALGGQNVKPFLKLESRDRWLGDGAGRLPQGVNHRLMGKALSSRL